MINVEIGGLTIKSCEGVYYPREDSMLLAEQVNRHAFGKVLDLGTGSGIQGIIAAINGCEVTFADIDDKAVSCARSNASLNGARGKFVKSDLFEGIEGKFNTIIFNPPYLASNEIAEKDLDGGKEGRELIDRFIGAYRNHLLERHAVLLLESSFNDYGKDVQKLGAEIIAKGHYFFEDIVVLLL